MNITQCMLAIPIEEWYELKKQVAELRENADKTSEYLTPKEVCELLKIGRATFERHKASGLIRVYSMKEAKRKYCKRNEILQLLEEEKQ